MIHRQNRRRQLVQLLIPAFLLLGACQSAEKSSQTPEQSREFVRNVRQLTYSGARAGEGYFSPDGKWMIFQSERDSENPFYQMYVMNLDDQKTKRVSPGWGKTTCGWIHPSQRTILFSSTHEDPNARAKQKEEIEQRRSGQTRRYAWDYDEHYDIYTATLDGRALKNLTRQKGYDAEASYSPDGKLIAFASNRLAYSSQLTPEEEKMLAHDPSYFMEIYIMNADGSNVRRLTTSPGYDGGPFFSPDGQRIVWRRFSPDGKTAEVFTMKIDGTDEKQITRLNAMSWAPFYHPSGDYLIFTTNLHGYDNFELYIVDAEGTQKPVRVTHLEGFDGLPVFKPNGRELTWNRKLADGTSQIFVADWDDEAARQALRLPRRLPPPEQMSPDIDKKDLATLVHYFASPELKGRATGTPEEVQYTDAIANYFKKLGLVPAVDKSFIQEFPFTKSAKLGTSNSLIFLEDDQHALQLNRDWVPLAFSKIGAFPASEIVFAGYGIVAPAEGNLKGYDSYAELDVKDKWVLVFRYLPEKIDAQWKQHLQRYSRLEHKAMVARNLGARGIIFVSGPNSGVKNDLIPFRSSGSGEMSISALSLSDAWAQRIFAKSGQDLKRLQSELDQGEQVQGFEIKGIKVAGDIEVRPQQARGRNVLGLLRIPGARHTLIIGAHGDHLGEGPGENSLMKSTDTSSIHYGADDNASGMAAVLELAAYLAADRKSLKQNILFAIWSGEELGNLGSSYFNKSLKNLKIQPSAYLNLDMVGRLPATATGFEAVSVQGTGSSARWGEIIERVQKPVAIKTQGDPYLPTDAMAFYLNKVPVLNFFSGVHVDYHTPRDTADKIHYDGLQNIAQLVLNIALQVAQEDTAVPYRQVEQQESPARGGFRLFLGTIPDYTSEGIKGVKISGVVRGGPAEKAGLRDGDIIVEFAKMKIENIHDYVFSLQSATPNTPTTIVVLRDGRKEELKITPQAKE